MKKAFPVLSLFLAFVILFSSASVVSYADGPGCTKKDVTAYIYSLDESETLTCLFLDTLPEEPYIDAIDYLKHAYVVDFTLSEEDGVFTIAREDSKMVVDTVNETLYFDDYDLFTATGGNLEGTSLYSGILECFSDSSSSDDLSASFDLAKYGFDLIADGGRVYFPLSLIANVCAASYNGAMYVDGNVYFYHSLEDLYFDNSSVICSEKRDAATAKFTYDIMCFVFDNLYGYPTNAKIAPSIAEKGFDRTLEEYDDVTREAKSLLLSTDPWDYFSALLYLFPYINDGGHTLIAHEIFDCYPYPGTPVFEGFVPIYWGVAPKTERNERIADSHRQIDEMYSVTVPVYAARQAAYSDDELVKEWEGDASLYVHGDMAIFLFDSFKNEILEPLKWSLDYAAEHGLCDFVFDIASNGGGSTEILEYIMTIITAKDTHSNVSEFMLLNTVTGVTNSTYSYIDLNLDGVFDEKDNEVAYDLHFAFLTSCASFSCGNALPVLAQEYGFPILGETSGGGACIVVRVFLPAGHYYYSSWNEKMSVASGRDFDLGAAVDYDLTGLNEDGSVDYSGLFDLDRVNELVDEFYAPKAGDVNGDGKLNALDVTMIMKYIVGYVDESFNVALADFDGNSRVNARDVIALMKATVTQ